MSKLSIIYDVTALCPWDCPICCMGASSNPECRRDELTREQKLAIVPMLTELRGAGYDVRIDLSGGEIFTNAWAQEAHGCVPLREAFDRNPAKRQCGCLLLGTRQQHRHCRG